MIMATSNQGQNQGANLGSNPGSYSQNVQGKEMEKNPSTDTRLGTQSTGTYQSRDEGREQRSGENRYQSSNDEGQSTSSNYNADLDKYMKNASYPSGKDDLVAHAQKSGNAEFARNLGARLKKSHYNTFNDIEKDM
jgi:hypothetical protein